MKTKLKNTILIIFTNCFIMLFLVFPISSNDKDLESGFRFQIASSMLDSSKPEEEKKENVEQSEFVGQKKEESTTEAVKETLVQVERTQDIATQQSTKKTVDQCADALVLGNKDFQLAALATCAREYQDNEKIHDALLKVVENSDDDRIITLSLLLLSNKKKDKISESLINIINSNKFQDNKIQSYNAILVLFSSLTNKYKSQGKEIFNQYVSSDDELLKHLAENIAKKN